MKYFERNEEALAEELAEQERRAAEFGIQVPMLYLHPGTTQVRILPAFDDRGVFFAKLWKHRVSRGRGADVFACPDVRDKKGNVIESRCGVCSLSAEFNASKEEAKLAYARENLRVREYGLYNVICFSAPANSKGEVPVFGQVYVLEAPITAHRQIISLDQDAATGWADIISPERGVNIAIKRTGVKFDTKYEVHPHGQGRTNLWNDLTARGVDPNSLVLFDLTKVYSVPSEEFVAEVVARIPKVFGETATAGNAPAFRPPAPQPQPFVPAAPPFQPPQATPAAPAYSPAPGTTPTPTFPQPAVQAGTPQPQPRGPAFPPPPGR